MTAIRKSTLDELRKFYSLAVLGVTNWNNELKAFAESELDKGYYLEFFRRFLFDENHRTDDVIKHLATEITQGHVNQLPSNSQMNRVFIATWMNEIVSHSNRSIALATELKWHFDDYFEKDEFNLTPIMSVFYQWWADYSEWMVGEELEIQRLKSISELQAAASEWLSAHRPDI